MKHKLFSFVIPDQGIIAKIHRNLEKSANLQIHVATKRLARRLCLIAYLTAGRVFTTQQILGSNEIELDFSSK